MAMRPYWSGQIRLSLVSLPVNLYSALSPARQIALHEIYRPTGQRVRHQNVVEGQPIERSDIVKGFEAEKGEYVILEPEEIKKLRIPSQKILEITQFVDHSSIDEIYFDTPYFVTPDSKPSEKAFVVIREALRSTGKVGLGQLAIGGRERLCSIKPFGSGMLLETLRYEEEIRASDPYFGDIDKDGVDKEELALAKELIKQKTSTFKPAEFHDHYREALQELINSKLEHRTPKDVVEEPPPAKIINLMDALRQSLKEKEKENESRPTKKTPPKPKATKTVSRRRKAI